MSRQFWTEVQDLKEAKKRICDTIDFAHDPGLEKILLKDKVVLDFGCGVGRNLKYLAHSESKIIYGYDFPNMLKMVKEYLDKQELERVVLIPPELKISLINKPNLDLVIATIIFQHMKSLEVEHDLKILKHHMNDDALMYVCSRGYFDDNEGIVWPVILKEFQPITPLDDKDGTEQHQQVLFKKRL